MHPEAHAAIGAMLEECGLPVDRPFRVLDIGGQNVNGTAHAWFPFADITTLDLENADINADIFRWDPVPLWDVVIATEVFEHVAEWPRIIEIASQCLRPDGPQLFLTTCASEHRIPHGATGAPAPAPGEHYANVDVIDLNREMRQHFRTVSTRYQFPPGDAYAWGSNYLQHQITVITPTFKGREGMLAEARHSVSQQWLPAVEHLTWNDENREGPAVVRNHLIDNAYTEWVAFLDDDDLLHPNHLYELALAQQQTDADVIWPWFEVTGGSDPFPSFRGRQWDRQDPHQFPITALVRRSALQQVGGFRTIDEGPTDRHGNRAGEDFDLWLRLSAAGFLFYSIPEITWTWRHHARNTSGLPSRR